MLAVGASNVTLAQLEEFATVCPLAAFQPPYNMLLRQIEADTLPWCRRRGVAVMVYWPLMKGLLAGRIARDQFFGPDDSRRKYPMFQGEERKKNHDLVDCLREIAGRCGHTVADLVIRWTVQQPGITCCAVRGQAARSDPRECRRFRVATRRSAVGRNRSGPGPASGLRRCARRCESLQLLPRAKVAQPARSIQDLAHAATFHAFGLLAYGLPWCMVSSRR